MPAKAEISTDWNVLSIVSRAGSTDFMIVEGNQLVCQDINQLTLDSAIGQYDHTAEIAKPSKVKGFEYDGVMVPVTNIDSSGAMEIKLGFEEFGMAETNFEMSNGLTLHLTAAEWPAFKAQFFLFRASFFG